MTSPGDKETRRQEEARLLMGLQRPEWLPVILARMNTIEDLLEGILEALKSKP